MTLVSAIMPTRGRKRYAEMAMQNFLSQTWPNKELIILDDPDMRSFEVPPIENNVRYILADRRYNIPEKRNRLCHAAAGDVIVHFDSDDWSAATRIEQQMEIMSRERLAVCGFRKMYFWQVAKNQAWIYSGASNYVLGTSLMFRRSWWEHNPWDTKFRIGSDNVFVTKAWNSKQLTVSIMMNLMVSRNHSDNTNNRNYGSSWRKCDGKLLPAEFFEPVRNETCV